MVSANRPVIVLEHERRPNEVAQCGHLLVADHVLHEGEDAWLQFSRRSVVDRVRRCTRGGSAGLRQGGTRGMDTVVLTTRERVPDTCTHGVRTYSTVSTGTPY